MHTKVNRSKVKVIRLLSRPTFFIYDDVQDGAEQVCGAAVTWPGAEQVGGAGVPWPGMDMHSIECPSS